MSIAILNRAYRCQRISTMILHVSYVYMNSTIGQHDVDKISNSIDKHIYISWLHNCLQLSRKCLLYVYRNSARCQKTTKCLQYCYEHFLGVR